MFSRAEGLENEELKMQELSERLAGIVKSQDPQVMAEAKNLLEQLYSMNRRWKMISRHSATC